MDENEIVIRIGIGESDMTESSMHKQITTIDYVSFIVFSLDRIIHSDICVTDLADLQI